MRSKLHRLLISLSLLGAFCFSLASPVFAAGYGEGAYGTCAYQTGCDEAGNPLPASPTSGAPNTGLEQTSLLVPLLIGLLGASLVVFVLIKYLRRAHRTK